MDKPRTNVILCVLLAIVLLASGVCALHWVNAVSLRGTVSAGSCVLTDGTRENLRLQVEDPWKDGRVIHITGALMRMDQTTGAVNVRVGLVKESQADEVIRLNTQMVRRPELAKEYGCDDHCGFHASVGRGRLEDAAYRVVVLDDAGEEVRLLETGLTVTLRGDEFAFAYADAQQKEAQDEP